MKDKVSPEETAAINEVISLLEGAITEARMALIAKNASGFSDSLQRAEGRADLAALNLRRIRRGHLPGQNPLTRAEHSI